MALNNLELILYDHDKHRSWLPAFTNIQIDCMETDGTIATFTRPWDTNAMTKWWITMGSSTQTGTSDSARDKDLQTGFRKILFVLAKTSQGEQELAGYAMLEGGFTQTGGFRASVMKLMVSPKHRRKGIARLLMEKIEVIAIQEKRTLLTLDTETGSAAEQIYPRLGYVRVREEQETKDARAMLMETQIGQIPDYGISPVDGKLIGGTLFYKILPGHLDIWGPKNSGGNILA